MDEDPNFIGDGKDRQALRKADWVDLLSDAGHDRVTRSGHRTQLMRQCWRAILNMPKLDIIEFMIMPARGKVTMSDIQHWEIRDIIPTLFRLTHKRVRAEIWLRIWEVAQEPINDIDGSFDEKHYYDVDNDGVYQEKSHFNLNLCIPDNWSKPTDRERSVAEALSARQGRWTLFPWDGTCASRECQKVRNYDALRELTDRLTADKNYEVTSDGTISRIRKRKRGGDGIKVSYPDQARKPA